MLVASSVSGTGPCVSEYKAHRNIWFGNCSTSVCARAIIAQMVPVATVSGPDRLFFGTERALARVFVRTVTFGRFW